MEVLQHQTSPLQRHPQPEFDMISLDPTQLPQVQADPTLSQELKRTVAANTFWFSFDVAVKPFDNLQVRQAFAAAVNREQYIKQITNGVGVPAGTLLYPGNPVYWSTCQQTYDPDKAKKLLADGGFPDGKDFPTQQLRYVADDAASQAWATFFSRNLKHVLGVTIEPTPIDATELQSLRSHRDPSLVFGIGEWWEDYPHPQNWLSLIFGPRDQVLERFRIRRIVCPGGQASHRSGYSDLSGSGCLSGRTGTRRVLHARREPDGLSRGICRGTSRIRHLSRI